MRYPDLGVVVVAGGSSARYGKNKLLEMLGDAPVLIHPLRNYAPVAGELVLVASAAYQAEYEKMLAQYLPGVPVTVTTGGDCRAESVRNGLAVLSRSIAYAAVADAARPLASCRQLEKLYEFAIRHHCGVISGRKIVDTVKRIDAAGRIIENVPREGLFCAETPQLFAVAELKKALASAIDASVTDDAEAMRRAGFDVAVLADEAANPKLTLPGDMDALKELL